MSTAPDDTLFSSPSSPPPPSGGGARPWLIAAIVVLSVALLALGWFGVRPLLTNPPATPSSTTAPPTAESPTAAPSSSPTPSPTVSHDTIKMSWSAPLQLDDDHNLAGTWPVGVFDSGVDGIALAGWRPGPDNIYAQAVDLTSMKILWKSPDVYAFSGSAYNSPFGSADGLVAGAGENTDLRVPGVWVIDPRTGATLWKAPTSYLVYGGISPTMFLTYTDKGSSRTICARQIASPDACVWQKSGPAMKMQTGVPFGDTSWVILGNQVVDFKTGEAAPFGQDLSLDEWGYSDIKFFGPSRDRIIRNSTADNTYQVWDTHKDVGLGQPIASIENVNNYPVAVADVAESPVFMAVSHSGEVTAYDWQTGAQQWQITLGPNIFGWAIQSVGNTAVFGGYSASETWAVDLATGAITGRRAAMDLSGNDILGGVAYLTDGTAGHPATALYAINPADLAELGSVALPEENVGVQIAAGHVIAVGQNTGRLYVLQTT